MSKAETVGIRDVLHFFKNAEIDTAELAIELAQDATQARRTQRAALSANLKKARAAKGKGKNAKAATNVASATDEADVRPPSLRARHAGEPASHATESASVVTA